MCNFLSCTHKNSHLFRNVLYCNSSVSQNECIKWIHHFRYDCPCGPTFILNSTINLFKQLGPFVKIFFTKTCFSVHITHSFVNFIWFVFLNHQRFHERPLFKPGAICLICHYFAQLQNKYVCKNWIIFILNQFHIMQSLHLWKTILKKINFAFLKKNSFYLLNDSCIYI